MFKVAQVVGAIALVVSVYACDNTGTTVTSTHRIDLLLGRLVTGVTSGPEHFDCVWLEEDSGKRVELSYPSGWDVEFHPFKLIDDRNTVVATEGDRLEVRVLADAIGASDCSTDPPLPAISVQKMP